MRSLALTLAAALTLPALPVVAQTNGMPPEVCDQTAGIVTEAQAMRVDGDTDARATRKLQRTYKDLGPAYTEQVIPVLVNFVYLQAEDQLDADLGAFWKEQCLTQDLSGALTGQTVSE